MFWRYCQHYSSTLCKFKDKNLVRCIGTRAGNYNDFQEVEIEVPWGKICGKYWGPSNVQPIIAIHGKQDNAGSFDPLAVRLPKNVSLFAFDLPGHGLSSWFPRGMQYSILASVHVLYRVKEYFRIDRLKLMGHSLGGIISFTYSSINPTGVKYIIALDDYKPVLFKSAMLTSTHKYQRTSIWNENSFKSRKSYTYESALKNIIKMSKNSLNIASSKMLIDRETTRQLDSRLCFNDDPRVKFFPLDGTASTDYTKILAKKIHCPFMFIRGDQFNYVDDRTRDHCYDVLQVIRKSSADFQFHSVPGTHHFHINNPELVARIINPFILKHAD